jgi:hypothetical protein
MTREMTEGDWAAVARIFAAIHRRRAGAGADKADEAKRPARQRAPKRQRVQPAAASKDS